MVISHEHGLVDYDCKLGEAFKASDIIEQMKRVRALSHPKAKLACFCDNASIHTSAAQRCRTDPQINIKMVFNAPYRPDLNGIEFAWRLVKAKYRKFCLAMKPQRTQWDNVEVVKECIGQVSNQQYADCASRGWKNLEKAVPIVNPENRYTLPSLVTSNVAVNRQA